MAFKTWANFLRALSLLATLALLVAVGSTVSPFASAQGVPAPRADYQFQSSRASSVAGALAASAEMTSRPTGPSGGSLIVHVPTVRNGFTDPTFGGTWRTGLQVLNLDASQSATVQLKFIRPDGTVAANTSSSGIEPGKSLTFFGNSIGVTDGFDGSAVIGADVPIAVVVNELAQDTGLADAFNGIAATAPKVYVPLLARGLNGTSTALYIQNAGTAPASQVKVTLYALGQSSPVATVTAVSPIAPGASLSLQPDALSRLGDGFQGSAVVEGDQPLAVVAHQSNDRSIVAMAGQVAGAGTLSGPLVLNNNAGFSSAVQVQNAGTASTDVTIQIINSLTGSAPAPQTRTLAPGTAVSWTIASLLGDDSRFVGPVTVMASSGGSLVGVVTQGNPSTNQASAYNLFTGGASSLVAPLIQTENSGWNSGLQVQNIGTSATSASLVVTDTSGDPISTVFNPTRTLAPGQSETWYPITSAGRRVVGAAMVTGGAGSQLIGVVNQLNLSAGSVDYFMTYPAINAGGGGSTPPTPTPSGATPTPTPTPSGATPTPTPSAGGDEEVFNNGNIAGVNNQPTVPTVFTLSCARTMTYIMTYHWNNGQGKPPGTIGLRDSSGQTYGPWQATSRPGQGGVPNAYWEVRPNATIPAGTYTIIDSDPATWAQNSGSGHAGMATIRASACGGTPATPTPGGAAPTPTIIISPTPILGTGDVQITLSWIANADLDLWVTDPSGERIGYSHRSSASGGRLDVDNKCSDMILGRPENIFWPTGGAPRGTYKVEVNYYRDCGNAGSVSYSVRVLVDGRVSLFTGTATQVGKTDTITTFQR